MSTALDSIVLEEEIDPNYEPTEKEVIEYATWLGMDLEAEKDLFWIAREGLKAPLPENWKPCKTTDTEEIYYFNFATGQSTWDHPCDEFYRNLYKQHKKKRRTNGEMTQDAAKQKDSDSIILEEKLDPDYEPTDKEVVEYAAWLGMDLKIDRHLLWIAREGLKTPMPANWKPCMTKDTNELYYFDFATGESSWDHPCDEVARKLFVEYKKAEWIMSHL